MGTIITRSDKEVLHFFDEMRRISELIDHLPADNRHLLDGENYLTDTELAGKILYRESDIVRLLEKNRKEAF